MSLFLEKVIFISFISWRFLIMALDILIDKLKGYALKISTLENNAREFLAKDYNLNGYRENMRQKAELLHDLPDHFQQTVQQLDLDTYTRKYIKDKLGGFSHGASKALALDSVFYMAALLYPEDYRDGDKNDLESFIFSLEEDNF